MSFEDRQLTTDARVVHQLALNIKAHLDRVEAQVVLISQHLGLPYVIEESPVPQEVVDLVRAGKRLEAMRKYRELTNSDLDEARQVVDQIRGPSPLIIGLLAEVCRMGWEGRWTFSTSGRCHRTRAAAQWSGVTS